MRQSCLTGNKINIPSNKVLQFSREKLENLVKKALSSTSYFYSTFIVVYISMVEDEKILNKVLSSIDGFSRHAETKKKILQARIEEIAKGNSKDCPIKI